MINALMKRPKSPGAEQQHRRPGLQFKMHHQPQTDNPSHVGSGKLKDKVALITGGDSGIGRAIAVAFAKEGADVAIAYLSEDRDAAETEHLVEKYGRKCLRVPGDLGDPIAVRETVRQVMREYGRIDVLINNAAEQHPQEKLEDITPEQLERTFRTNVFAMFYVTQVVLPHLREGASIINTASVTAFKGNPILLDYSSTKGAIIGFTRSLALSLAPKGIRVNAVAPGPIWTPLIPSTFSSEQVKKFGQDVPLGRVGQPAEVAPAYVYLASDDASYMSGQTLHVNGGSIINS